MDSHLSSSSAEQRKSHSIEDSPTATGFPSDDDFNIWSNQYIGFILCLNNIIGFYNVLNYSALVRDYGGLTVVIPMFFSYVFVAFPLLYMHSFFAQYINRSMPVVLHRLGKVFTGLSLSILIVEVIQIITLNTVAVRIIVTYIRYAEMTNFTITPITFSNISTYARENIFGKVYNVYDRYAGGREYSLSKYGPFQWDVFIIMMVVTVLLTLMYSSSIHTRMVLSLGMTGVLILTFIAIVLYLLIDAPDWLGMIGRFMIFQNHTGEILRKPNFWKRIILHTIMSTSAGPNIQLSFIASRFKYNDKLLVRTMGLVIIDLWVSFLWGCVGLGLGGIICDRYGIPTTYYFADRLTEPFALEMLLNGVVISVVNHKKIWVFMMILYLTCTWLQSIVFIVDPVKELFNELYSRRQRGNLSANGRLIAPICCSAAMIFSVPLCFPGGNQLIVIWMTLAESLPVIFVFCECLIVSYCYKWNRLSLDLILSQEEKWNPGPILRPLFGVLIPIVLFITFILHLITDIPIQYYKGTSMGQLGETTYWIFALLLLLPIPLYATYAKCTTSLSFQQLITPRKT